MSSRLAVRVLAFLLPLVPSTAAAKAQCRWERGREFDSGAIKLYC